MPYQGTVTFGNNKTFIDVPKGSMHGQRQSGSAMTGRMGELAPQALGSRCARLNTGQPHRVLEDSELLTLLPYLDQVSHLPATAGGCSGSEQHGAGQDS